MTKKQTETILLISQGKERRFEKLASLSGTNTNLNHAHLPSTPYSQWLFPELFHFISTTIPTV